MKYNDCKREIQFQTHNLPMHFCSISSVTVKETRVIIYIIGFGLGPHRLLNCACFMFHLTFWVHLQVECALTFGPSDK